MPSQCSPHYFQGRDRDVTIEKIIPFSLLGHTKSAASKLFVRTFGMYAAAQMISSSQNLSLLFLSNSIHWKWILCWTVSKEEEDWEFESCITKEQENCLPLLPLTVYAKQCKSTKLSNSSGYHATESARKKMKTESVSSIDGKVSVYKRQWKGTLMLMDSSPLIAPTSHPQKHMTCNTIKSAFPKLH